MFRDKISGIAVAATLGTATLLGATHANAQINLDATDKSKPAVLFSSELVEATGITGVGDNAGMTWHQVSPASGAATLSIQVKLGHRALANDIIEVKYDLSNMVFGTVDSAAAAFTAAGFTADFTTATLPTALTGKSTATIVFTATNNPAADATLTWAVGSSGDGVFGIAPGGDGTITATVTNLTVARAGGSAGHMASYPNAVQLGSSLDVGSMPSNLTADVGDGFMSFVRDRFSTDQRLTGSVGKVHAKLATPAPMNPATGAAVNISDILAVAATTDSRVTLTGNFGDFLANDTDTTTDGLQGAVSLHSTMACGDPLTTGGRASVPVTIDDGKGVVAFSALTAGNAPAVATLDHYVCITADGETAIPATEAYGAMVELERNTTNVSATTTLPSGTHPLGMIGRDGTTIRIPYITTYSEYNQRLVLVNRGDETRYEIEFMPEDGIMADPESMEGMLPAGTSMMLTRDIVTLTGGTRTAASITVDADPSMIDAATVTVNNMDGSTDTVTHTGN